jgi:hypothetical protein
MEFHLDPQIALVFKLIVTHEITSDGQINWFLISRERENLFGHHLEWEAEWKKVMMEFVTRYSIQSGIVENILRQGFQDAVSAKLDLENR